jgi:DNA polymerase-1
MTSIAARVARARSDRIATMIATAAGLGVEFVRAGDDLLLRGHDRLPAEDRVLLETNLGQLRSRLIGDAEGDPYEILDALDIDLEEAVDAEHARAVITGLPDTIGFDLETCARPEYQPPRRPLVITKGGRLRTHQPKVKGERLGLDPIRARARIVSVFDPGAGKSWLFDLDHIPLEALAGLWSRRLVIWNAAFDLAILEAAGITPARWLDGMQLAGLVYGCGRVPGRKTTWRAIETAAGRALGLDLDKTMQTSDWSAPYLSDQQRIYAGADSAVAYKAAVALRGRVAPSALPAFRLQSGSARATARMRLRGLPFNAETHRATIERWRAERDQAHATFVEAAGIEPPPHPRALAAWLEEQLDPAIVATLPRTPTGQLSTRTDDLERLAGIAPEVRPLMRLRWAAHRLNAFGEPLLRAVHPVTGRVHADFMHCAAKTGRMRCKEPNVQQLEADSRAAIEAPAGSLLVWADLGQIEARVEAELAPDPELRAVFTDGRCVHCITAAATHGVPENSIAREGDPRRDAAKPIVYGTIYGAGPATLAATAFKKYRIEMSVEEARHAKNAFLTRFPGVAAYQVRMADEPVVYSITGRPLRPDWETPRKGQEEAEISYCQRVNFPTQSSAGDVLLNAMILVDRYLPNTMILSLHDELVLEVPEDEAGQVKDVLANIMIDACLRWFPDMPTRDLCKAKIGRIWS